MSFLKKIPELVYACILMVLSVFFVTAMNTGAKLSSPYHDPIEIVFYRGCVALAVMTIWMVATNNYKLLKTNRPFTHLGRSVVGNIGVCMVFWAYALLPMASATTIILTSGVMVTLLSAIFLKEKVGPWRWGAVCFGLCGCLIATDMHGADFNPVGTMVAMVAMVTTSLVAIFLRHMGKTEHAFTTVFYFVLAGVLSSGLYMVFKGHAPDPNAYWILLATGLFSLFSLLFKTESYKFAEVSLLSPLQYTALVWSVTFGWMFWGDVPSVMVLSGAGLVVASNAVIVWRESVHRKRHSLNPADVALVTDELDVEEPLAETDIAKCA